MFGTINLRAWEVECSNRHHVYALLLCFSGRGGGCDYQCIGVIPDHPSGRGNAKRVLPRDCHRYAKEWLHHTTHSLFQEFISYMPEDFSPNCRGTNSFGD
jgi:hypothetical protein